MPKLLKVLSRFSRFENYSFFFSIDKERTRAVGSFSLPIQEITVDLKYRLHLAKHFDDDNDIVLAVSYSINSTRGRKNICKLYLPNKFCVHKTYFV